MAAPNLTAAHLRKLLSYDPDSGLFTWLPRPPESFKGPRAGAMWHTRYCGQIAGGLSGIGHISIRIEDRAYWSHRLAVLYMTGSWPNGEVDHINGIKTDNRYENLRDVPGRMNRQNTRQSPRTKSTALPLGVHYNARLKKHPFSAHLHVDEAKMHLGYFLTAEDAHHAYVEAKRFHHPGCTI